MTVPVLEFRDVSAGYDGTEVLHGISFKLFAGEALGLLGRNGMGKTTLIRAILAQAQVSSGALRFGGESIAGRPTDVIARTGVALVPEGRQIFANLTVAENLKAFAACRCPSAAPWNLERVYDLFPVLAGRARNLGNQLSGGEQQMLAIGRALMTNPRLLLVDEATEGLAPLVREQIWTCLAQLRREGQTMIVVDKLVQRIVELADRHLILERGRVAWTGGSEELGADPSLRERYLGV
jgi:branched-chain amino acid transport system ATP-binding protein